MKAYLSGLGQNFADDERPTASGDADIYPRISFAHTGVQAKAFHVARLDTAYENIRTLNIEFEDEDNFVSDLKDNLAGGGCVAIICNTVGRAQVLYDQLKADPFLDRVASEGRPMLDLLHSRFRFIDRQKRERLALKRFGKAGSTVLMTENGRKVSLSVERPDTAVLISTQIIEQSLDLDFDLMISDLAPIDLMLQRSGRLQRHQRENRPDAFRGADSGAAKPSLWILRPPLGENNALINITNGRGKGEPDFGVSGLIYEKHVLLRSWLGIKNRDKISVPDEVEELIEAVYSADPISDASEAEEAFLAITRTNYLKSLDDEREQAKTRYISRPDFDGGLGNLLGVPKEEDAPELHPDSQAMLWDSRC